MKAFLKTAVRPGNFLLIVSDALVRSVLHSSENQSVTSTIFLTASLSPSALRGPSPTGYPDSVRCHRKIVSLGRSLYFFLQKGCHYVNLKAADRSF